MKKTATLIGIFICLLTYAQPIKKHIAIIPEPVSIKQGSGTFILPSSVMIEAGSQPALKQVIAVLKDRFSVATGRNVLVSTTAPNATIRLVLGKRKEDTIGEEGYHLSVNAKNIVITAEKPAGLFYGVQSLLQLFPKEIESKSLIKNVKWEAPVVEITDVPRFGWRGLMFDVSRHFFTKAEVKQFIDDMVRYKYNLLHLHLTDDEGWRIEIKGLPKLTEVGAWNVKKTGYFGTFSAPTPEEPNNYGGFYTQEDIKELVKYAKDRFVNILPEIDVPGHSLAAVVSYPELSCTPEANTYRVRSGEEIMDWSKGAPPIALVDNTLCPANEKVYEFLDKVMTQVAELFPFEYIHVGGDECPKNYWEKTEAIKQLMQREGLKNMEEVQSYFEKRLEKIVESKGKKFMGWDEILEGGLAPSAAVMSWRGMEGGIEAAKMKHDVVMSPTTFAYLDYMQSDPIMEPHIYASLRLNKAYAFEPVPDGVEAKYIKGGQANLWTEQVYNMRHQQYMTWPRGFAIAEALWSPKEKRNWNHFFARVEKHFERFDVAEMKYAPSVYDPIFTPSITAGNQLKIELGKEVEALTIHYSFDNSFPDKFYPTYTEPLIAPKDAVMLKVITYKDNKPVGRMIAMPLTELRSRVGKK
ncbi:MAG: family 20 glycosylhydrolase [Sediminibacterium sp.]|nr:family 20 glycosylhydrolase [Sediminibacterium sp.]MDP1811491.1 family 20 glycosylhydrolase [Sediminibacterium sp.]MDP3127249.1 family 20 glycosylhydrolase [Sediminibacterium sp.]MDP3667505.1 family 20 glycosylhydrolase [Sediminibacterium sp.]